MAHGGMPRSFCSDKCFHYRNVVSCTSSTYFFTAKVIMSKRKRFLKILFFYFSRNLDCKMRRRVDFCPGNTVAVDQKLFDSISGENTHQESQITEKLSNKSTSSQRNSQLSLSFAASQSYQSYISLIFSENEAFFVSSNTSF